MKLKLMILFSQLYTYTGIVTNVINMQSHNYLSVLDILWFLIKILHSIDWQFTNYAHLVADSKLSHIYIWSKSLNIIGHDIKICLMYNE